MSDRMEFVLRQAQHDRSRLDRRAFGTAGLTALGIASVVGAGIFVSLALFAARQRSAIASAPMRGTPSPLARS